MLIPVCRRIRAPIRTARPNAADAGNSAMPSDDSANPPRTSGSLPRPRAVARSETGPAHGTSSSNSTLSMAMTAPIAVRCSPSMSRTSGGTNALISGPVTPEKRPPRPITAIAAYGARATLRALASSVVEGTSNAVTALPSDDPEGPQNVDHGHGNHTVDDHHPAERDERRSEGHTRQRRADPEVARVDVFGNDPAGRRSEHRRFGAQVQRRHHRRHDRRRRDYAHRRRPGDHVAHDA